MVRTPRRNATGTQLKVAIVRSKFLPDKPEPFRKAMVENAMASEGISTTTAMVDQALRKLQMQGYLIRTAEMEGTWQAHHLWMFARADRTSERPGFRPGEKGDLWKEGEK